MINSKRYAFLVLLTFMGMATTFTSTHAFGRGKKSQQIQSQGEYVTVHTLLSNTNISGEVFDSLGNAYNGSFNIIVKNVNNVVIGAPPAFSGGSYNYTIPGNPSVPNNIIKIYYKKTGGTLTPPYTVSYTEGTHVIHPILP